MSTFWSRMCGRHGLPRRRPPPLFQNVIRPNILKQATDTGAIAEIQAKAVPTVFGYLERWLTATIWWR